MRPVAKCSSFGPLLLIMILGSLLGYILFGPTSLLAQAIGTPPKITGIAITATGATSTTVSWDTDIQADSEVNYGLDKNYGIARDAFPDKTHHTVVVTDLEPSMVYHLRIGSHDAAGNQALTGDYVVTTKGIVNVKDINKIPPEERAIVERIGSASASRWPFQGSCRSATLSKLREV